MVSFSNKEEYTRGFLPYDWKGYYGQMVDHCINRVGEHLSNGYDPQDLMILVRIAKNPRLMNLLIEGAKAKGIKLATSGRNPKAVRVMSIHKSKGLQAKAVFLLNVIDHTYGLPCTIEDLDVFAPAIEGIPRPREEEERRLFYVAITRAKEDLDIYTQSCRESKFIKEIKSLLQSDVSAKKEMGRAEALQPKTNEPQFPSNFKYCIFCGEKTPISSDYCIICGKKVRLWAQPPPRM